MVVQRQHLDPKCRHHAGFGDDLDLGDGVADDAEGEYGPGPPARSPHRSGRAVDERQFGRRARPERALATARPPRTSGARRGAPRSRFAAAASTAARSARSTASGSSRVTSASKSPWRDAARKASTISCWRRRSPGAQFVAALDPPPGPAGQLAGGGRRAADDRRDVLERHGEQVVEHEGQALRRAERLEHQEQRRADGVGEDRLFLGTGRFGLGSSRSLSGSSGGSGGSGAPRGTPGTGPW